VLATEAQQLLAMPLRPSEESLATMRAGIEEQLRNQVSVRISKDGHVFVSWNSA
jgi:hypothetical protein